ncbi:MAG: DUF255 domain-containing protein [Flavobacteriales bacterium]|nr:DUF255 domain-containing protein [Flavobacteriales bacterium]
MKKALLLLLFVSTLFTISSTTKTQHVAWKQWNEGYPSAKSQNKVAIIDVYTDWCGWCKKMDKDTYEDSTIMAMIDEDFVAIKFNPELGGLYNVNDTTLDGRTLLSAMNQGGPNSGYPTTFFYIPSINQMYKVPGYHGAEEFKSILEQIQEFHESQAKGQ